MFLDGGKVEVWDIVSGQCVHSLNAFENSVNIIKVKQNNIVPHSSIFLFT